MATIIGGRAGTSHPYTCNTCQVAFRNIELQRNHMKGDWHRYNLKRRVASLPAISSEVFNDKVLQARAATTAQADKVGFERACEVCQKTYYSENSYQNHIGSQKHRAKEAARSSAPDKQHERAFDETSSVVSSTFSLGAPIPTGNINKVELDSDAEEEFSQVIEGLKSTNINDRPSPVKRPSNPHLSAAGQRRADHPLSEPSSETPSGSTTPVNSNKQDAPVLTVQSCLFCNYESPTSRLNAVHMERIHGMFIPEKQYLVDLDGLITALKQRIQELHECICCGKVKSNAFAVQTHMRDTGHCMIPFTTEEEQLEIGEFYDFRSTYSDNEEEDDDSSSEAGEGGADGGGGAKLGAKRTAKVTGEDGSEIDEDGDGWETDSSASSLDSADLTAVPAEKHYHQYERLDRHPHHSSHDPRSHHQRDGWHSRAHKHTHAAFYDEYELHLPSGKHVGHRAHNKYYRQNLRHYPSPAEREQRALALRDGSGSPEPMDVDGLNRLARRRGPAYQSLVLRRATEQGLQGVAKKMTRAIQRSEQRGRAGQRRQRSYLDHMGRAGANHQKHFHYSKLGG